MTDITPASTDQQKIEGSSARRARITGGILIALALLVVFVLDVGAGSVATFKLTTARDAVQVGDLVVPGQFNYIAAAIIAFLGVRQFLRGGVRWSSLSLGIGLALVVVTFLVWATAGKAFSLTGMLQATMVRAVPIALGGLAGVLCERVAVVNIAIEGMLLAGAFTGALLGSVFGGITGLAAAVVQEGEEVGRALKRRAPADGQEMFVENALLLRGDPGDVKGQIGMRLEQG